MQMYVQYELDVVGSRQNKAAHERRAGGARHRQGTWVNPSSTQPGPARSTNSRRTEAQGRHTHSQYVYG